MSNLNKIILLGEVVSEMDVKATTSGHTVANFVLQVQRPKRSDVVDSQFDLIKVVAWRELAEENKTLPKGSLVLVEGRILTRSYEDQAGVRKYVTEVEAVDIKPVGGSVVSQSEAASSLSEMPQKTGADEVFSFEDQNTESGSASVDFGKQVEEDIPF